MLKLIIEDDEGRKTVVPFVREEITIGRQEGNTIRLTERNVSRRHARLLRQNGAVLVEDLGSYNGIRINGEKIQGRAQVQDGDLIQIGDYDLAVQHEGQAQPHAHQPPPPPPATLTPEPAPPPSNGAHHANHSTGDASATGATPPELPSAGPPPMPPPVPSAASRGQSTSIIRVDQVEGTPRREQVEIDASEAPRLFCINTEYAGREYACIRSELKVGRTDDNDISIDHRSLSRTHAKIVRESNGEWRVIDMQSANGVSVNGESYAQATLRPGDTLELGHVKFKFLAAGQEFKFKRGDDDDQPKRRSKAPLLVIGVLVVGGAVGGVAYVALNKPARVPAPPPPVTLTKMTPPVPTPTPTPTPVPPKVDEQWDARINSARDFIDAAEIEKALSALNALRADKALPDDKRKEVDGLLDQSRQELEMKKKLALAEKAVADGKLKEAQELLAQTESTVAFSKQQQALTAKIEAEQKRLEQAALHPPRPTLPKPPAKPTPAEEAGGLYKDALSLFKNHQYRDAKVQLNKCVEVDPSFATCHMLLGSVYAKLSDNEQGAQHYRIFIKLAPDDPHAAGVRTLLEQYDESRKGTK